MKARQTGHRDGYSLPIFLLPAIRWRASYCQPFAGGLPVASYSLAG